MKLYDFGLALIIFGIFGWGVFTLDKAEDICKAKNNSPVITKECLKEAASPMVAPRSDQFNS